jgi:hypothetical protein
MLVHLFFGLLVLNILIISYFIYSFIQIKVLGNSSGDKLQKKKEMVHYKSN